MNKNVDDDELEDMIMRGPTAREAKTGDHDMMFKALGNPVRRKIIVSIGAFGKSLAEVMKETGVNRSQLDYQLDFLNKGEFAVVEGDICRLTDKGLGLLSNI
ncbi:MAG: winged helix-turn-helix domain-containing protein [ANME-2 cluster archaeon]|nr:winged helix-turn-helix domain-containing protein [ANME-2 cluster archaeon]MDF1531437.1 winged helix-turn-helix domain-containing protein [ANME-2 cluster archaeon]